MRDNVILGIALLFLAMGLISSVAGLYTYWWFGIFRPHDWIWGSIMSDLRLPLVAALILVIPAALRNKVPKINNIIAVLIVLVFIAEIIANTVNGCDGVLRVRTATVLSLFVLFYIVLLTPEIIDNKKKLFWLIAVISISIASHSAKGGIHSLITGSDNYGASNLTGLFSGSNAFALGTGMLLFFMIFTTQHISSSFVYRNASSNWYNNPVLLKVYKILFIIIVVGSFYNIVSLQSRGSFLATVLGLFIWVILQKNRFKILAISIIIISIGLSIIPLPEGYEERINSVFAEEEERDNSAASRPHFWAVAVNMVAENPLGVGPGCYPAFYNAYDISDGQYGHFRSVHSSHFQMLADTGYFGIMIWILLMLISYWKLYKIRCISNTQIEDEDSKRFLVDVANMLVCSMTVFIIGGSFYEYAYNDIIWLIFALVIVTEKLVEREIMACEKSIR